jgi:beta-glucosidase/6-phospho-beta-glucosidase/beta-galactosidase
MSQVRTSLANKFAHTDGSLAIANRTADFLGVEYYKKHMNEAELAKRLKMRHGTANITIQI